MLTERQKRGRAYASYILRGLTREQIFGGNPDGARMAWEQEQPYTAVPVCGHTGRRFNPARLDAGEPNY